MPKFIENADLKSLIVWLFLSNLTLIGVICSGAVYVHNSAVTDLKADNEEAKQERYEMRKDITDIKISMAGLKK